MQLVIPPLLALIVLELPDPDIEIPVPATRDVISSVVLVSPLLVIVEPEMEIPVPATYVILLTGQAFLQTPPMQTFPSYLTRKRSAVSVVLRIVSGE